MAALTISVTALTIACANLGAQVWTYHRRTGDRWPKTKRAKTATPDDRPGRLYHANRRPTSRNTGAET